MKVNKEQVKTALQVYVDRELMNKGTSSQKFVTFMAASLVLNKLDEVWQPLTTNKAASMLGIADGSGMVDADAIINAASSAIDHSGPINIAGLIFNKSDIEAFNRYLQEVVSCS